jgi:hypothetical protein
LVAAWNAWKSLVTEEAAKWNLYID